MARKHRKKSNGVTPLPTQLPERGRGHPPYQRNDYDRGRVEAFVRAGYGEEAIARMMPMGRSTLRDHYDFELKHARGMFITALAQTAGQLALGREAVWGDPDPVTRERKLLREEMKPDAGMVRYCLSSLAADLGWGDKLKLLGDKRNPLELDFTNLPDSQLEQFLIFARRRLTQGPLVVDGPSGGGN